MRSWGLALLLVGGCALTEAPSHYALGVRARETLSYGEALTHYQAAVCESPLELLRMVELVEVWEKLGHPGTVGGLVRGCDVPPLSRAYLEMLGYASSGEYSRALSILEEVSLAGTLEGVSPPLQAEFLQRGALISLVAGDGAGGRALLNRALLHAPSRSDIRLLSARAFFVGEESERALKELRSLLLLKPDGNEVLQARRLIRALSERGEAPLTPAARNQLSRYLSLLEREDPGSGLLSEVTDFAAGVRHSRAYVVAGMVALRLNLTHEARRLLLLAAALNPGSVEPYKVLGLSFVARKKMVEAFEPLREASKRDPFDAGVLSALARVSVAVGERSIAAQTYRTLIKVEANRSAHFLHLARIERTLGEYHRARVSISRGLQLEESIPLALESALIETEYFRARSRRGERALERLDADRAIQRLVDLSPGHPALGSLRSALDALS